MRLLVAMLVGALNASLGIHAAAGEAGAALSFQQEMERQPLTPGEEAALKEIMGSRASTALAKLEAAVTPEDRFYALPDAATGAFYLERFPLAAKLAHESLDAAARFKGNWNFGNAVHHGHTVLGLVALRDGDTRRAVEELHKAGDTPGSPQLDSFGPSMQLAQALLRAGRSEDVLRYLDQCEVFWKHGEPWLGIWREKIRAAAIPNFPMNLW